MSDQEKPVWTVNTEHPVKREDTYTTILLEPNYLQGSSNELAQRCTRR